VIYTDLDGFVDSDCFALIRGYEFGAVVAYFQCFVMTDSLTLVVFDEDVPVFLALQIYLFFADLIFKAQFVEVCVGAAGGASGFDTALGFVGGQAVIGLFDCVYYAAGNDRIIHVAVDKRDEDFVTDARNELAAVSITSRWI